VAEVRAEQDDSNRVSDKPPQIPRYPFQGSGHKDTAIQDAPSSDSGISVAR